MKTIVYSVMFFFAYLVLVASASMAADQINVPLNSGNMFLHGADGKDYPAQVCYTTDGNGNVIPVGGGGGSTAVDQGNKNASHAQSWWVHISDGTHDANVTAAGALQCDGSGVTQPVSAASLPLPSGASTSAKQDAGNTSLSSIDSKMNSLGQKAMAASMPVVIASDQSTLAISAASLPLPAGASTSANQTTANSSLSSIDGKLNSLGQKAMAASVPVVISSDQSTLAISAASLPLPTGAATSANQTTANSSLSSIDSKTPALGQTTKANSQPVTIASDQGPLSTTQAANANGSYATSSSITTSPTSFSAPANAIGFLLEAESGNTANIRWAVGSAASTTNGVLAEAGRDTGFIPMAATISVASVSGTQSVDIQWILSQ